MRRPGVGAERLIGLFLIGAIGFSPPVLTLFNKPLLVAGIPLLYLYLFGLWILLVVLAGLVIMQLVPAEEPPPRADAGAPTIPANEPGPAREGGG